MKKEMRAEIKKQFEEAGYIVEEHAKKSNGVVSHGFVLKRNKQDAICPVYYEDQIEGFLREGKTISEIGRMAYEQADQAEIITTWLCSKEEFKKHLTICLQKDSDEDIEKKSSGFEGLEKFVCLVVVNDDELYGRVCNVRPFLKKVGITEDEAWIIAEENMKQNIQICGLYEFLYRNVPKAIASYTVPRDELVYVLSVKGYMYGAGAVTIHEVLAAFAKEHQVSSLLVLPSSVHEVLLVPGADESQLQMFSEMVSEVNASEVLEEDRLTDRAYILKF